VICFYKHKHPRAFPATYALNASPMLVFVYLLESARVELISRCSSLVEIKKPSPTPASRALLF